MPPNYTEMSTSYKWGYNSENGPNTWSKHFPAGNGAHQSPINIDTKAANVRFDGTLTPLQMSYDPLSARTMKNTGASFQIGFADEGNNVLSGGPLEHKYHLVQIHAHWSAKSDRGSEHTLDGRAFASEVCVAIKIICQLIKKNYNLGSLCSLQQRKICLCG